MTDAPSSASPQEEKQDPTLNARRLLVWVVAFGLGAGSFRHSHHDQ